MPRDRRGLSAMAMSQSERLRLIQESATKVVSRNKCVDSSLYTMVQQAKASGTAAPQTVAAVVDRNDCPTNAVIRGRGTNGEYLAILQAAQNCAICPDVAPADTGVTPVVILPTVCPNFTTVPFAQQNISTIYPAPYVAPCSDPGNRVYFPTLPLRGEGGAYEHLPYDSAN